MPIVTHQTHDAILRQPQGNARVQGEHPMLCIGSLIRSLMVVMLVLSGLYSPAWGDFVHPGIYHNAADLAFMRQKITAQAEPWLSGWKKLQADTHSQVTWSPHAVAEWDANADSYMHGDAMAVYSHALEWAMTGNQAHADKAIAILNSWSSTFKTISGQTSQEMLVCSWNACYLANAAELLVYGGIPGGKPSGWAPADIDRCKKMLRYMYGVMKDFKPTFNGNWDASMMNSIACIGVFCDDQAMFDHAIEHFYGKDVQGRGGT